MLKTISMAAIATLLLFGLNTLSTTMQLPPVNTLALFAGEKDLKVAKKRVPTVVNNLLSLGEDDEDEMIAQISIHGEMFKKTLEGNGVLASETLIYNDMFDTLSNYVNLRVLIHDYHYFKLVRNKDLSSERMMEFYEEIRPIIAKFKKSKMSGDKSQMREIMEKHGVELEDVAKGFRDIPSIGLNEEEQRKYFYTFFGLIDYLGETDPYILYSDMQDDRLIETHNHLDIEYLIYSRSNRTLLKHLKTLRSFSPQEAQKYEEKIINYFRKDHDFNELEIEIVLNIIDRILVVNIQENNIHYQYPELWQELKETFENY